MERTEARILDTHNILISLSHPAGECPIQDFCGVVLDDLSRDLPCLSGKTVYLCGDLSRIPSVDLAAADRVFVIRDLSHGACEGYESVDLGRVPMRVHGVGVYFRRFFDPGADYFNRINKEHAFQALTESNKPGVAHRTGIYLTPVEPQGEDLLPSSPATSIPDNRRES